MNILILCDKFLPVSEQFIYNQVRSLQNHRLFLFCRRGVTRKLYPVDFEKEFIWYDHLKLRLLFKLKRNKKVYPDAVQKELKAFIRDNKIGLVYIHYGTTATTYAKALQQLKVPYICAFHGFDASRKLTDPSYKNSLLSLADEALYFTAPSQYLGNKLIDIGISEKILRTIPYGADLDKIEAIETLPAENNDKIRLIHAGRLVPKKGVPDLVRVFADLSRSYLNIELIIVGGGEEEEKVRRLIEDEGLNASVRLTGPVPHEKLIGYLKSSDIFILNSRETEGGETEGLPNSIMEAMACKVAVVSTRHSGIPELLTHRKDGFLVDPQNNGELKAALTELINIESLRKQIAIEGYDTVSKRFSFQQMKESIISMVNEVDT
ncbi:MAG: glycosyltransferase family 4 protein [Cyclobacteriaceae bacterium]